MRVSVRYHLHDPNGPLKSYECAAPPLHCCASMSRAWEEGTITLGVPGGVPVPENLGLVLATAYHWADGETLTTVMPLHFCPFCGSAVRVFLDGDGEDGDDADFLPF